MSCYTIQNATTAYNYPNLNCTPGNTVPGATNTRRDTHILVDGQWYQTQTTTISTTNNTSLVVAELPQPYQDVPVRDLVLPSTLIVLAFMSIILNIFRGVRRK